ncbi:MAG TPA: endonuclease/exonuclease/phosphatase family protein [Actinomycetes bacterium]|jgi:endonuclease/exonuclease/phosphatase family metal-dependent hydrolase|nr:endonuclease/exonuclease/phosphatase family protein [Actinomycetes bacterium]
MSLLRVATWNVRTCRTRDPDPDGVDLGTTAAILRSIDADLVALQEIDRAQERSGGADQARALGELLRMRWWYRPALLGDLSQPQTWSWPAPPVDPGGPAYGIALLSRVEPESVTPVPLPPPRGRGEPRVALVARIALAGGPLTVAATHLSFMPRSAVRQLRWLQRRLEAEPAPRLLLGDLNLCLPMVLASSRRGWRPLARGHTFPNRPPGSARGSVQIDHVLASGGDRLRVRRSRVAAGPISDHRALVVDLEVG